VDVPGLHRTPQPIIADVTTSALVDTLLFFLCSGDVRLRFVFSVRFHCRQGSSFYYRLRFFAPKPDRADNYYLPG